MKTILNQYPTRNILRLEVVTELQLLELFLNMGWELYSFLIIFLVFASLKIVSQASCYVYELECLVNTLSGGEWG